MVTWERFVQAGKDSESGLRAMLFGDCHRSVETHNG